MKNLRLGLIALAAGCGTSRTPALGDSALAASSTEMSTPVLSSTAAVESMAALPAMPSIGQHSAPSAPRPGSSAGDDVDIALLRTELIIPVSGVVPGELRDTFTESRSSGRVHDAIDIPAPRGTTVVSASSGRVLKLFTSKLGGLMVYAADSSGRFILLYAHLDGYAPGLSDGAQLTRGQTVGFVGTTGNAPPNLPHLHFAIERAVDISKWWQGTAVNPYPILRNR